MYLVAKHQCSIGKISRLASLKIYFKSIAVGLFDFAFRGREKYGVVSGDASKRKIFGKAIYLHSRDFEIFLAHRNRYLVKNLKSHIFCSSMRIMSFTVIISTAVWSHLLRRKNITQK